MTIDEVIEKHKKLKINAERTNDKRGAFYSAEEHEQIAEWLEELVMLRLDSCMIHMPERLRLVENGYNKAIDDFQEWLKTQIVGIDNKTNEILVVVDDRWELAADKFKEND